MGTVPKLLGTGPILWGTVPGIVGTVPGIVGTVPIVWALGRHPMGRISVVGKWVRSCAIAFSQSRWALAVTLQPRTRIRSGIDPVRMGTVPDVLGTVPDDCEGWGTDPRSMISCPAVR